MLVYTSVSQPGEHVSIGVTYVYVNANI